MVTFTLPEKLRALCRAHSRLGYTLLFRESAGTLQEIAANPKHLGVELGFLGVLCGAAAAELCREAGQGVLDKIDEPINALRR